MDNKYYYTIRETCQLVDYSYKLAAKFGLWIETYQSKNTYYCALFSPDSTSDLPITITTYAS